MYSRVVDQPRLKEPKPEPAVKLELNKELKGGIYVTIEELAPHADEPVEILLYDEVFYHAGDLSVPARPNTGIDMH